MAQGQSIAIFVSPEGKTLKDIPMAAGEVSQKGAMLMVTASELLAADDVGVIDGGFGGISQSEVAATEIPERFIPEWFDVLDASGSLIVGETAMLETPTSVTDAAGATVNHAVLTVIGINPEGRSGYVRVVPNFAAT